MMKAIYSLFIYLYKGIVYFYSLFNPKARLKIDGIKHSMSEIEEQLRGSNDKRLLIHCASQGEHEQARPIISWILNNTTFTIVLSFFSPSGYRNVDYSSEKRIHKIYLPFDTTFKMSKLLRIIKPQIAIIIKNEWWWNLLYALNKANVKSFLVSATIRPSHYFIKHPFHFFRQGLETFSSIFVVDEESKSNISKVYKGRVCLSRDTRIDQVNLNKKENANYGSKDKTAYVIVYGSVWEDDIDSITELIRLYPLATHLIYPHLLDEETLTLFTSKLSGAEIVVSTSDGTSGINIVSSMGQLKYAYRLANMAYVGGGFGAGIHNILEASVYHIPVLFGPNFEKSNEAKDLVREQCAFTFSDPNALTDICAKLDENSIRKEIETKLKTYFSPNFSPTEIICREIFQKKE